uniref:Uncharacterized protein n=1 Tax=Oryza barthii TaxID=65489 RepID=A0A0D3HIY9_9ORYZ
MANEGLEAEKGMLVVELATRTGLGGCGPRLAPSKAMSGMMSCCVDDAAAGNGVTAYLTWSSRQLRMAFGGGRQDDYGGIHDALVVMAFLWMKLAKGFGGIRRSYEAAQKRSKTCAIEATKR